MVNIGAIVQGAEMNSTITNANLSAANVAIL
jgi:hypothetical protein